MPQIILLPIIPLASVARSGQYDYKYKARNSSFKTLKTTSFSKFFSESGMAEAYCLEKNRGGHMIKTSIIDIHSCGRSA